MKAILLGVLMVVMGGVMFGQQSEILIVEESGIVMGANKGLFLIILRPSGEPEEIKLPFLTTKDDMVANYKIRYAAFTKLYKEGWHLVSTVGDPVNCRYIFEREKP